MVPSADEKLMLGKRKQQLPRKIHGYLVGSGKLQPLLLPLRGCMLSSPLGSSPSPTCCCRLAFSPLCPETSACHVTLASGGSNSASDVTQPFIVLIPNLWEKLVGPALVKRPFPVPSAMVGVVSDSWDCPCITDVLTTQLGTWRCSRNVMATA